MALMVETGEDELEIYELRLLEAMEPTEERDDRRNEGKREDMDGKRVVRMFAFEVGGSWLRVL